MASARHVPIQRLSRRDLLRVDLFGSSALAGAGLLDSLPVALPDADGFALLQTAAICRGLVD